MAAPTTDPAPKPDPDAPTGGPPPVGPRWVPWAAWAVPMGFVLFHLGVIAWVVAQRIGAPFELEWMEGSLLDQTAQLRSGGALYGEPTLEHIPYLYTPLYYYVSAVVSWVTGLELWVLRAINLGCMVGTAALLGLLVRRETGQRLPGVLAGGILMAGYQLSDTWYDVARNDGLYMLMVGATLLVLRSKMRGAEYLAAVFVVLAFLAKQSIGLLLPFVCLAAIADGWWRAVRFGAASALGLAIVWGGYAWATNGWFHFFVFTMPRAHNPQEDGFLVNFLTRDIAPLKWMLPALFLWASLSLARENRRRFAFFGLITLGMFFSAWQSRLHAGGYKNAVIPALWATGLVFGLLAGRLQAGNCYRRQHGGIAWLPTLSGIAVLLLAALQLFALHGTAPKPLDRKVPGEAHWTAHDQWRRYLAGVEGEIYLPFTGGLTEGMGKPRAGHAMAMADILRHQENTLTYRQPDWQQWPVWSALVADINEELSTHRFAVVVVEEPYQHLWFKYFDMEKLGYRRAEIPLADPGLLRPVVGLERLPHSIWVPADK